MFLVLFRHIQGLHPFLIVRAFALQRDDAMTLGGPKTNM